MTICKHCQAHVSGRFARVFGDDRGRVFACPNCTTNAGIAAVTKRRAKRYRP